MIQKVIIGIGEALWDMLPSGKALGGAPANFAYHAAKLGSEAWAISAISNDSLGRELKQLLDNQPLHTLFEYVDQATGTVQVELDSLGKPIYNITEDVAWDNIPFTPDMQQLAQRADAICFGSLVQRNPVSRNTVMSVLNAVPTTCLKVFDINLRQHYYNEQVLTQSLELADILKINDEEIDIVAKMYALSTNQEEACRCLIEKFGLKFVILTKGEKGSSIITNNQIINQAPEKLDNIVDTVGAGDAFTAAFVVNYLNGKSLSEAQELASLTAAKVCTQKGAMN